MLTLGDQGVLLASRDAVFRTAALPIEPVSTVGAGDSFRGSMVWALASGQGLADAFRYGVAVGSAALITPGTELCHREDVKRLYRRVVMHSILNQAFAGLVIYLLSCWLIPPLRSCA